MLRFFFICIISYLSIVIPACIFQKRMLYYPANFTMKTLATFIHDANLIPWPDPSMQTCLGIYRAPEDKPAKGTVIVFHGNAGAAYHRNYYPNALNKLGYRVIVAEYPGYGARSGKRGEKSFVDDALRIIEKARALYPASPIYLWGESLGCGVVTGAVAQLTNTISGIILLTPWDNLSNLAQKVYPFLPVKWLLREKYDNIENMKNYPGPVAVLLADQDEIIPNRLTQRLYASIKSPKKLWTFSSAGHNTWPADPDKKWWAQVMSFISENADRPSGG